jgi:hypothetical protein
LSTGYSKTREFKQKGQVIMPTRLTQEDRNAVDMLLDKTATGFSSKSVSPEHLRAAEKLLNLLGACPAEDPSADLVAKTMRRIEGAVAPIRTTPIGTPTTDQPHA